MGRRQSAMTFSRVHGGLLRPLRGAEHHREAWPRSNRVFITNVDTPWSYHWLVFGADGHRWGNETGPFAGTDFPRRRWSSAEMSGLWALPSRAFSSGKQGVPHARRVHHPFQATEAMFKATRA